MLTFIFAPKRPKIHAGLNLINNKVVYSLSLPAILPLGGIIGLTSSVSVKLTEGFSLTSVVSLIAF